MITQTTEYALRIVVHLATLRGEPATTEQIAAATKIPLGYLAKVIQSLNRGGLVSSQRGRNGGSVLALPPEKISVLTVLQAVGPIQRIHTCPLGIQSHGKSLCALHQRLDDAMAMIEDAFGDSTIAELLSEKRSSRPLCETSGSNDPKASKPIRLTIANKK